VVCAGKAGDIHIWDRVSAVLLRHIRAQDVGGDLTCIAWNPAAEDPFMFAAGSHDGAVRIWSTPTPTIGIQEPQMLQPRAGPSLGITYGIGHSAVDNLSPSPVGLDIEFQRSESPAPQLDSDSQTHLNGSSRERTVAFAMSEHESR